MSGKNLLSSPLPTIQDLSRDKSVQGAENSGTKWINPLQKIWHYLKGANTEKINEPDPAAALILQIADLEVAKIVRDLHYRTPRSLKAMRNACESCFVLPDDCPYYDYSIFDVKKAVKRLVVQPRHTHQLVVEELRKINRELASHLAEYLE